MDQKSKPVYQSGKSNQESESSQIGREPDWPSKGVKKMADLILRKAEFLLDVSKENGYETSGSRSKVGLRENIIKNCLKQLDILYEQDYAVLFINGTDSDNTKKAILDEFPLTDASFANDPKNKGFMISHITSRLDRILQTLHYMQTMTVVTRDRITYYSDGEKLGEEIHLMIEIRLIIGRYLGIKAADLILSEIIHHVRKLDAGLAEWILKNMDCRLINTLSVLQYGELVVLTDIARDLVDILNTHPFETIMDVPFKVARLITGKGEDSSGR